MLEKVTLAVKNKWNWSCLEVKDVNDAFLSCYIRKLDVAGLVFCVYCNKVLKYGSTRKSDLLKHAKLVIERDVALLQ